MDGSHESFWQARQLVKDWIAISCCQIDAEIVVQPRNLAEWPIMSQSLCYNKDADVDAPPSTQCVVSKVSG